MRQHLLRVAPPAVLLALAVLIGGCGGTNSVSDDQQGISAAGVPSSQDALTPVLVGFKSSPGPSDEALLHARNGQIKYTYHLIPAVAASLPPAAIEALRHNPRIAYIEPDATAQATADSVPWGITRVKADLAWSAGNVGAGVKIAILDTGVDYRHPDLAANYKGGYDFVNADADPMDDHGHGTHVAGTAAAAADGANVKGAGPGAAVYALKVLDRNAAGAYGGIIAGLQWCVDNRIPVASMSLGGTISSTALQSACDAAYAGGVLLVAAAGNGGNSRGTGTSIEYPAAYASVIAVASTDSSDRRASTSATGADLELAAPGAGIVSDKLGGGTTSLSGTSMACPHVSGVAALVIASGVTGPAAVRSKLTSTATDLGTTGRDALYGYGLVNAAKALGIVTLAPTPKPRPGPKTR